MNHDDLLFPVDDLDLWKKRELPEDWLAERMDILIARCQAQSTELAKLLNSSNSALLARLKGPL